MSQCSIPYQKFIPTNSSVMPHANHPEWQFHNKNSLRKLIHSERPRFLGERQGKLAKNSSGINLLYQVKPHPMTETPQIYQKDLTHQQTLSKAARDTQRSSIATHNLEFCLTFTMAKIKQRARHSLSLPENLHWYRKQFSPKLSKEPT